MVDLSRDPIWPFSPIVSRINEGECTRLYSSVASFPANLYITNGAREQCVSEVLSRLSSAIGG